MKKSDTTSQNTSTSRPKKSKRIPKNCTWISQQVPLRHQPQHKFVQKPTTNSTPAWPASTRTSAQLGEESQIQRKPSPVNMRADVILQQDKDPSTHPKAPQDNPIARRSCFSLKYCTCAGQSNHGWRWSNIFRRMVAAKTAKNTPSILRNIWRHDSNYGRPFCGHVGL